MAQKKNESPKDYERFINREVSFLAFARRVLGMVHDPEVPLLERVKFAGIVGMLHDEFAMKRLSGLKRQIRKKKPKRSLDGRTPHQEFDVCRQELLAQSEQLADAVDASLRGALAEAGLPILDHSQLEPAQAEHLRAYFRESVMPILTPLAVDAEHPFPFISNLGLNLAVFLPSDGEQERFVRIKVPNNRPRWVPLPGGRSFVPMEQVIAANLDLLFPSTPPRRVHFFRVTRGAEGDTDRTVNDLTIEEALREPGSIVRQVSSELKARKFAGAVRLQVDAAMPRATVRWLLQQLEMSPEDVYPAQHFLGLADLREFEVGEDRPELRYEKHEPVAHPRLRAIGAGDAAGFFREIARGDVLLHHPYHSFDGSVLQFLQAATDDPDVLAIKLTIYRTSRESPIVRTLAEASRRGKQVAVLVEITARFDEAPNIAWGKFLEEEGCHVAYGVGRLKTHVKLALVVREERGALRRYLHVGTGNYHSGTARIYEDLGLLTCDPKLCDEAAAVFNELTGSTPYPKYERMLVAPVNMRERFVEFIRREAEHAREGRPCGIYAKMNQLQDVVIIRELYAASEAGVPITLNVRGLCCLRPGVKGFSSNIRLYGVIGRFLEHSRLYRFENGGEPAYYFGSADWMTRNLNNRVETVAPVADRTLQVEIDAMIQVYERDNCSVWDCDGEGNYVRRRVAAGEPRRNAQEIFLDGARDPRIPLLLEDE